ncbi:MAG: cell division protein ZapA [Smithella sp.]|nr:cell division protein ZapA [Syntrophaceae bacterium]NTW78361.1 cell division protein ZapA [Syntrophaceae bacterium]
MKKSYKINILGQELSVLSDADDEHVLSVIQLITDKTEEVLKSANNLKALDVAILTALNIAEELVKLKGVNKELCDQLESRSEELIQLIENAR